jgi:monofunctional biosynthetic peptidoglycan transglycosylase
LRSIVLFLAILVAGFYLFCVAALAAMRWVNPPTTMVQTQRRIEAWMADRPYRKRAAWVPLSQVSKDLPHAVIAAEDGRFYQHHGIDWAEVQKVVDRDLEEGKLGRGGSTITQQLVKNLFFTTSRSVVRKAIEFTLAPVAEWLLPKPRILEIYLNVIEWAPGIYGAEAAAENWYGVPAAKLDREQSARLAAVIPAPLKRRPSRMNTYAAEIERRMTQMGW